MTATEPTRPASRPPLVVEAELQLGNARVQIVRLNHPAPRAHMFVRKDAYWVDLCMTPRRPAARARFIDRWGPHRFAPMGSMAALPPRFNLDLRHEGGRHVSVICEVPAAAVHRWLPEDFQWTDRRLEACLDIASSTIRGVMLRLFDEVRRPRVGAKELGEALATELAIDIARYLTAIAEPTDQGGLAAWRLRVIDKRCADPGEPPTLAELASLCDMSVRQLTRGFRTSRGCSIGDYLAHGRIEAAKRRLATDEPLSSVATATGFSSQASFTYAFRRATGATPREFRQRILRANAYRQPLESA